MTVMDSPRIERAKAPPRENVLREAPFTLRAEADEAGDGRTLDGFAAVFNRETVIDSWEGRFREKISPGSMKKSFRERPPRIQFDHGRHPLVGSIPIARVVSAREETHPELAPDGGAHLVGRLHDNWLIEPVRDAIASESIDGMSFRFSVVRDMWFDADGKRITDEEKLFDQLRRTWFEDVADDELLLRELRELKVPEMGPVVWPAYDDTSVGVRSEKLIVDLGHLDDPEERKTLARAVFLADAAERMNTDNESPPATDDESAGGHDDTTETLVRDGISPEEAAAVDLTDPDEPRATEDDSAGEHPSTTEDEAPRSTEGHEAPAGEHDTEDALPKPEIMRFSGHLGSDIPDWYLPTPGDS